jgi:hypothetical protein
MYYIGLDVHKKTISYCVKDVSGQIHRQGTIGATRNELDVWMKNIPPPWAVAMEATIFTGWIYDHLLPHAAQVKVAHLVMLRAIAAAKKKNDRIDAGKIADCLRCDFLPECHMVSTEICDRRRKGRVIRYGAARVLSDRHFAVRHGLFQTAPNINHNSAGMSASLKFERSGRPESGPKARYGLTVITPNSPLL